MTGRPRSTAPRRTELIKILVTADLAAAVTAAAKREGRSVSDWGSRLFERELGEKSGNSMETVQSNGARRSKSSSRIRDR